MKKVLFATTALVAMSGAAAAEVSLSGSANAGVRDTGGAGDPFLHYELDLDVTFSGSTDNGLTFGASMDLDENSGSTDPEIFISGAFGTLTFGALDPMLDNIGLRDPGFDGIGIDNVAEGVRFNGSAANITYMYEGAGVTFGVSTYMSESAGGSPNEGDFGILLGYEAEGFGAEVAYDYDDSMNRSQWGLNLGYSDDMFAVNVMYSDGDGGQGYGFDASYTIDAFTLLAVYATDTVVDAFGIGATYDLGGGLKLSGGIGHIDDGVTDTVWDLGLTMSF